MNKLRYRLIFNKSRGLMMAVAETTRSAGNSVGSGGPSVVDPAAADCAMTARLRQMARAVQGALALLTGAWLLAGPAAAQIIADHNAPKRQQPTILNAANGVMQVNIQTPSAAGVSRNTYSQFDVPAAGVILNNARNATQTQLGGWVDGNPWLAAGGAKVILNEVNSNNPSQLRGYLEVAGQRAEMVVANAAGIVVDGGGFINVSRATLTTGTPTFNNGALDGYAVRGGTVSVRGNGLDARQTDYAALIARSVELNAGVWGQQMSVTAGANQVAATSGTAADVAQPIAGSGPAPQVGIDAAELGGMYANQITLIGTEAGVGVRNAGYLGAVAGNVVVTSAGWLENSGTITASAALRAQAQGDVGNSGTIAGGAAVGVISGAAINNSGTISADAGLALQASGALSNSGTLSGQSGVQGQADSLVNRGTITSAGRTELALRGDVYNDGGTILGLGIALGSSEGAIDNHEGKIIQGGGTALDISVSTLINTNGQLGAPAPADNGNSGGTGTPPADKGGEGGVGSDAGNGTSPPPDNSAGGGSGAGTTPAPMANGVLHAAGVLNNNAGVISVGGAISLAVATLDNSGSTLLLDNLAVNGLGFSNHGGNLTIRHDFNANTATFDNAGGTLLVGDTLGGQVGQLDNHDGLLQAGLLQLDVAGALDNTNGVLRQSGTGAGHLGVGATLINEQGTLETAGSLALAAGTIAGNGKLTVLGDLQLNSGAATLGGGSWLVNGNATLHTGTLDTSNAVLSAGGDLDLSSDALNNQGGQIAAASNASLDIVGALDNSGGTVQAGQNLALTAGGALNNENGAIVAIGTASTLQLAADFIDNTDGRIVNAGTGAASVTAAHAIVNTGLIAGNGDLRVGAQTLRNDSAATVSAGGALMLAVVEQLDNAGQIGSAGALQFGEADAELRNRGQISAGGALGIAVQTIDNDGGLIATIAGSTAGVTLSAATVSNRAGAVQSEGGLALTTTLGDFDNSGGRLQAQGDASLNVAGTLANHGGVVATLGGGSQLQVQAGAIDNGAGQVVNNGNGVTRIVADGAIGSAGQIAGNGDVTVGAATLVNSGTVAAGGALDVAVTQSMNNTGHISSAGVLSLGRATADLHNQGVIVAGGTASIDVHLLDNDGGQIATTAASGADVTISAASLSNENGLLQAAGSANVAVWGAIDNAQGTVQAGQDVSLMAGGTLTNRSGVIEALGEYAGLTLQAGSIDNTAGRMVDVGTGPASVTSRGDVLNSGLIAGNGNLTLAAQTVHNQSAGTVAAGGKLDLTIGQLLDNAGAIGSGGTLDVHGANAEIDNSGSISAGAAAHLTAGRLDNDGGQIATATGSGASIDIDSASLSNVGGRILADGDARLTLTGNVDNGQGMLHAGRNLQLTAGGALGNQGGNIEAAGTAATLSLQAQNIDNTAGRIVNAGTNDTTIGSAGGVLNSGLIAGNGALALSAESVDNKAGGTIAAAAALSLDIAQQLDNAGTVSSGAALDFQQSTAIVNNRGQIVAGGDAHLMAGAWNNDGGQLATAAGTQADITLLSASLSNRGGRIVADRDALLTVQGEVDNSQGAIQSGRDLALSATGALENTGGAMEAAGAASNLNVQAASIDNGAGGRLVNAGTGATVINAQGEIQNGGVIAGNGDVAVSAARLQNAAGATLASGGNLALDMAQQLTNGGAISSAGALDFSQVTAVVQNSGQIVSAGPAHLAAGSWNNDGGQIATVAGGGADVALTADSLSNHGGAILADGGAVLTIAGALDNTQGTIQVQNNLQLAAGGGLNNDGGSIAAQGADSVLNVRAQSIANGSGRIANSGSGDTTVTSAGAITSAGLIAGNGKVVLDALSLDNGIGGTVASGGDLQLRLTQSLANEGTINSAGALTFDEGAATLRNSGQIVAGGDAIVHANDINNDGGQLGTGAGSDADLALTADTLSNQAGRISADRDLSVDTHYLLSGGDMGAGRDLSLRLDGDYTNDAQSNLHANRDLSLTLTGTLTNTAKLGAVRALSVNADAIDNQAGASISAQNLTLTAAGTINNGGEIDGIDTLDLTAGTLTNSNAIIGGVATLRAQNITNTGASALLGATADLTLLASETLSNTAGATIYSAGDIAIAGDAAGNPANVVNNIDATIEAAGNLDMAAGTLNNVRSNVSIVQVKTVDETVHMDLPSWQQHGNNNNYFDANSSNYNPHISYFVNPADIISNTTVVTPDGQTIGQVTFKTHANDSVFYSAWSGLYSSYGDSARVTASDGTMTLYYTVENDNVANPDQGGPADNAYINDGAVTSWGANAPSFSSAYGSCGADCIRFVTQPGYDDPRTTLIRDTATRSLEKSGGLEASLDAHHMATGDQLAPGAGSGGQIISGGDMHLAIGQTLNNLYSSITAGGALAIAGNAAITNQGVTLYRTHTFDGTWTDDAGDVTAYTNPSISEVIGTVGGVISGNQGVSIAGQSFNNIDTSAGTVGNIRDAVNVIGSGGNDASTAGGVTTGMGGIGRLGVGVSVNGAAVQGGVGTQTGGSLFAGTLSGKAGVNGAAGVASASVKANGGASQVGAAPPVQGAALGPSNDGRNIVDIAPNGLSLRNPNPNGPLFETRPQFANRGNWISSDYQLQQLGYDPSTIQKRLGDGFYEERLVNEQLAELTGRAPAGGSADDTLYQKLLTDGVSYAREWSLRPGIALSADQVAQLTCDIVWLVTETVRLPDGTMQDVLVPQVYLAHAGADAVKPSGALVTGEDVSITTADSIANRGGVIDGGNGRTVLIAGGDIVNQGGAIKGGAVGLMAGGDIVNQSLAVKQDYASSNTSGSYTTLSNQVGITATGALAIVAGRDLVDTGGTINAASATISAGRDIKFDALQTVSSYQAQVGQSVEQDSSIHNKVGQVTTSGDVTTIAGRDLSLSGTQVVAGTSGTGNAVLSAGGDLTVMTVVDSVDTDKHNDATSQHYDKQVHQDQTVVGAGVAAAGNVLLNAGAGETGSLNVTGSTIAGGGAVVLAATGDVNINAAMENHVSDTAYHSESHGLTKNSSDTSADYSNVNKAVGSSVGGDSVMVQAGNDINVKASQITATNALNLEAGRDLNVASVVQTDSEQHSAQHSQSGLGFSPGTMVTNNKSDTARSGASETVQQVGSVLSGGSVNVHSGRDTTVAGSTVVADGDVNIAAGRDLAIISAQDSSTSTSASSSHQSGSIGTVFQPAIGSVKSAEDGTSNSTTQVGSQVASLGGNVDLSAGEQYTQTASEVLAPRGDIAIAAKDVLINAAVDHSDGLDHNTYSKTAIGGSVSVPLVDAAKGLGGMVQAAKTTSSGRLQALAAVNMIASGGAVKDTAMALAAGNMGGFKASVSLGHNESESTVAQTADMAAGSAVKAGGNVSITATGGGKDSNLTVIGGDIVGGGNVALAADNAVNLLASQSTDSQHSTNSASGQSIGIGYAMGGSQNGFTLDASVNQGRGHADGNEVVNNSTHVNAGSTASIVSGGDTNIKGAVVSGKTATADVGSNLNVESLQDTSSYDSKQTSSGAGVSLCIPPFCYGASTVSGSVGKSTVNGDYKSVTEQSGIQAGDGGFQVNVQGNTDLKGGVIASNEKATTDGRNNINTGTLTTSDLHNTDQYSADAFSVSGSISGKMGDQSTASSAEDKRAADDKYNPAKPTAGIGFGSASGSQDSATASGISGGAVTVRNDAGQQALTGQTADQAVAGVNRDVVTGKDGSGALTQGWNGGALDKEVHAQAVIVQAATGEVFEAYDTAFLQKATVYELVKDKDGKQVFDDKGKAMTRTLSDEEKQSLKPGSDGKVHVTDNGIFNDPDAAAKYANQHNEADGPQYAIHFPEANNIVSELLIAAYQKNLEGNTLGLTNATAETKSLMIQYGQTGLQLDGHSRGSMTIGNAMESLLDQSDAKGLLSDSKVHFFGPAYNAAKADDILAFLQNREAADPLKQGDMVLKYENHMADPIGGLLGGNPATGGTIPNGSSVLGQAVKALFGIYTVHNCYGSGALDCRPFWKDSSNSMPELKFLSPEKIKGNEQ